MLKRFLHFLQYNNALPIAFSALFLSVSGAFAASPDARDAVYSAQSAVRSVDNTYLASINPENRDFKLRITGIKEDDEKYYIDYSYNTVDIKDYVWQEIPVSKTMTVSKKELLGGDLGIFVARELSQLVDGQKNYLKESKKIALKEGITQKVVTVEYSGLVGKFLNPTEETFAGYTPTKPDTDTLATPPAPVVAPPVVPTSTGESSPIPASISTPSQPPAPDASAIRAMIEQAVREALANNASGNTAAVSNSSGSSSAGSSSSGASGSSQNTNTGTSVDTTTSTTSASSSSDSATSSSSENIAPSPDTTAPTITLNGNNPADVEVGSSYLDLGAVVTDNVDQNLGFTMTPSSVDTSTTSTQTLTFTATDSAGNSASVTRTVNVH